MATEQQVRQYLAYWFQLGKQVFIQNGKVALLPHPVIEGDRYSQKFEDCWQQIVAPTAGDCYLEGTRQTIQELLTPAWDLHPCARCAMPVALPNVGVTSLDCVCSDLPNWPDSEKPAPRDPISSQSRLSQIRDRLKQLSDRHAQDEVSEQSQVT